MTPAVSRVPAAYAGRSIALLALVLCACGERSDSDRSAQADLARGRQLYDLHCAACHGAKLEGQPKWRERLPNGRLPAPPHDPSGHTWHHPDRVLFEITKHGMARYAPPGYTSDMPAFGERLSDDDIRAVLGYIRSTWPQTTRKLQAEVTREDEVRRR